MANSIAVVQFGIHPYEYQENFWSRVERHIRDAESQGIRLLVFPEYLTAHLLASAPVMDHPQAMAYIDAHTDEYRARFTRWSRETGMTILAGTHIHREGDGFVNEAFLFYPNGRVEGQKKVHLTPEERNAWGLTPGDRFSVFDTEVGRVAILICYDIEFPEASRIVADLGAEAILCPSYTDTAHGYWRVRLCSQARAIENQLYVALAGMVGSLPHVPQIDTGYCQAGIFAPCDHPFTPDGILSLGLVNQAMVVAGSPDLDRLKENGVLGQVSPYLDRKPEIYAAHGASRVEPRLPEGHVNRVEGLVEKEKPLLEAFADGTRPKEQAEVRLRPEAVDDTSP